MNGGYFEIQRKLPSLNEVLNKNRANKYAAAKMKKDIDAEISLYIMQALSKKTLIPMQEKKCVIKITWYEENRRRDIDNIQSSQKFILDALQKCGVIKNDSQKYVIGIYHEVICSGVNKVKVELQEADE